jgi:methyl-accepting chemotaxis protein
MPTTTASGASKHRDSFAAGVEAANTAVAKLRGEAPDYGFVFASPTHDLGAVLRGAREAAGALDVIGCTTAGEITEGGLTHEGVSLMLVASKSSAASVAFASGLRANPEHVAHQLHQPAGLQRKTGGTRNLRQATTVVLIDGLAGAGEKVVVDLHDRAPTGSQVVGGAAGDEGKFKSTTVGAGVSAATDAAVAMHVLGEQKWGVGVGHGLRATTKPMRVTRTSGNVVYELDGEPALQAYHRHAAERGIKLTSGNLSSYLIAKQLGIHFFDRIIRARAPLSAGADGSLACAAEIPKGSMVSILDGEPASMLEAARAAAEEAKEHLEGGEAAGVLLFDCVCRGMILKSAFNREVEAVRSVFGDVPVAGFLTYGEIARYQGSLDGWHNATAVVVAIPK